MDPAELIGEISAKEDTCREIIGMAGFLYEKNMELEVKNETLINQHAKLEEKNDNLESELCELKVNKNIM